MRNPILGDEVLRSYGSEGAQYYDRVLEFLLNQDAAHNTAVRQGDNVKPSLKAYCAGFDVII